MSVGVGDMEQKFKRDLNRVSDTDRMTRKRGLQKLLEDLPWSSNADKAALRDFCNAHVFAAVNGCVQDSVEKCRELALEIIKKMIEGSLLDLFDHGPRVIHVLCTRIADTPFPENTEELRLTIVELLLQILKATKELTSPVVDTILAEVILKATGKILTDNFPAVKKASAELLQFIAKNWKESVRMAFSTLLKPLTANVLHQHNKTRSATLKALGLCLVCMEDGYDIAMKDPVLPLLGRVAADRTPSTRRELAVLCRIVLKKRAKQAALTLRSLEEADNSLLVLLLLLMKDENNDVSVAASESLDSVAQLWYKNKQIAASTTLADGAIVASNPMDIVDGEATLRAVSMPTVSIPSELVDEDLDNMNIELTINHRKLLLQSELRPVAVLLLQGVEGWTADARLRYLGGLRMFIEIAQEQCEELLPILLHGIGIVIRDEETPVREAAQDACRVLAKFVNGKALLELLLPRAKGLLAGGDTASQRVVAVRLLTYVVVGIADRFSEALQLTDSSREDSAMVIVEDIEDVEVCSEIADMVGCSHLHEFREVYLREALVLLIRNVVLSFPTVWSRKLPVQREVLRALLYLSCHCPGETDVVPAASQMEIVRLAVLNQLVQNSYPVLVSSPPPATAAVQSVVAASISELAVENRIRLVSDLLGQHFEGLLEALCPGFTNPEWTPSSPGKGAFEELVKACHLHAWKSHVHVISIIALQVQPKQRPAEGTPEAIALSYAAQRGEEAVASSGEVDVRLTLLALLEGLIRQGTADWECGSSIAAACESILRSIVVPNLVWRVGRVEATIRKVALAACYGLLKAGAARPEALYKSAGELVPLIASHLDDSDVSPRLMSCFCMTVIFERLRGAFGEQALLEIYPKLLKRLDDSNDEVRVAVCATLTMFLQCAASPAHYKGTMLDYMLDQLFVHLDDPDEMIQDNVEVVILQASKIDKELVERKAERNRTTHRTPARCDKVLVEVRGFEILEN